MVNLALEPPSRPPPRRGPLRRLALLGALGGALALGFWLGRVSVRRGWLAGDGPPGVAARPAPAAAPAPGGPPAPEAGTPGVRLPAEALGSVAAPPLAPPAPADPAAPRRLAVTVSGPLEDAISGALGGGDRRLASELTAVVNRLLVWDLRIARDGRRGDRLEVLWTPPRAAPGTPGSDEPVVEAVRYASSKLGNVVAAYRFQPEGARWARYYRPDGTELEPRLVDAPVADYEQITSLLRDGRRHKGVDFKTPVGSPVHAPFDGVVERRNWNFAGNGNCLDIRDPATGRHAIFLHLDVLPRAMAVGRAVRKGEVVASSGNSGHSFAPHLHYQLEDAGGRVLDPFEAQPTERRALVAAQRAAFDAERARLDARLRG